MSYEVEQKYRVSEHETVIERLEHLGAAPTSKVVQVDLYLNHPARDFATTHEAFRLRKIGDFNAMTYKGPKRSGLAKTREEIEIPFEPGNDSSDDMLQLLLRLGFKEVAEIRKVRQSYHLERNGKRIEIAIDDAESIGKFVEIEVIAENEAALSEAQTAVLSLARDLALSEVETRSYLRMWLERGAGV